MTSEGSEKWWPTNLQQRWVEGRSFKFFLEFAHRRHWKEWCDNQRRHKRDWVQCELLLGESWSLPLVQQMQSKLLQRESWSLSLVWLIFSIRRALDEVVDHFATEHAGQHARVAFAIVHGLQGRLIRLRCPVAREEHEAGAR